MVLVFHQIEGEDIQVLYPGDIVFCPPGKKHWHVGSLSGEFAHVAINTNSDEGNVTWYSSPSYSEYLSIQESNI